MPVRQTFNNRPHIIARTQHNRPLSPGLMP